MPLFLLIVVKCVNFSGFGWRGHSLSSLLNLVTGSVDGVVKSSFVANFSSFSGEVSKHRILGYEVTVCHSLSSLLNVRDPGSVGARVVGSGVPIFLLSGEVCQFIGFQVARSQLVTVYLHS